MRGAVPSFARMGVSYPWGASFRRSMANVSSWGTRVRDSIGSALRWDVAVFRSDGHVLFMGHTRTSLIRLRPT
jgi:hypothetical protein